MTASYSEVPLGDRAGFVRQPALSDPLPSTLTTLCLEYFRSEALSQRNAGHETKSWLEQLTVHMWFWHYELIPLGNDFQVFVFFGFLFCLLKQWFYFLTFISIQIYCAPLHSSWCDFWNHLHCSHFCLCSKLASTSHGQTTPHMTADHEICNCIKPSC